MASSLHEPTGDPSPATTDVVIPGTFAEYLRGMGPGIVVVMSWLGTGDFISASVAGSNYGYALIWTLLIAVVSRYFIVSAIAKYQLCNKVGDKTILDGFRRVWRGFPIYLGVTTCMLGFVYCCFLYIATGTALAQLVGMVVPLGPWGPFLGALVSLAFAIWIVTRGNQQMRWLEILANLTMAILVLSFFAALLGTGIDVGALVSGLAFDLPEGENGYITAVSTAVALIGAVGGSAANLLYPYLIHDKGWTGPQHRKLQRFDLLFGTMTMFVLVLAVWVVAAETLHGTSDKIVSEAGLAFMMEKAIGPAGPAIMWCAIFFTVFNNIVTQPPVFARLMMESVYMDNPEREHRIRLRTRNSTSSVKLMYMHDPAYWWILIPVMTIPVLFSLPGMPGMVVVTMMGISFSVLTVPPIMVGLISMTTRHDLMLQPYLNRWWETALLGGIGLVGLWATYELIDGLVRNYL